MPRGTRLLVKAVPGSSRDRIDGWLGEALKVRLKAPAEGGRANAALERIVAEALGVAAAAARIVAGGSSPRKIVEISDLSEPEVRERLSRPR